MGWCLKPQQPQRDRRNEEPAGDDRCAPAHVTREQAEQDAPGGQLSLQHLAGAESFRAGEPDQRATAQTMCVIVAGGPDQAHGSGLKRCTVDRKHDPRRRRRAGGMEDGRECGRVTEPVVDDDPHPASVAALQVAARDRCVAGAGALDHVAPGAPAVGRVVNAGHQGVVIGIAGDPAHPEPSGHRGVAPRRGQPDRRRPRALLGGEHRPGGHELDLRGGGREAGRERVRRRVADLVELHAGVAEQLAGGVEGAQTGR